MSTYSKTSSTFGNWGRERIEGGKLEEERGSGVLVYSHIRQRKVDFKDSFKCTKRPFLEGGQGEGNWGRK